MPDSMMQLVDFGMTFLLQISQRSSLLFAIQPEPKWLDLLDEKQSM
jgi:hypothetical protein